MRFNDFWFFYSRSSFYSGSLSIFLLIVGDNFFFIYFISFLFVFSLFSLFILKLFIYFTSASVLSSIWDWTGSTAFSSDSPLLKYHKAIPPAKTKPILPSVISELLSNFKIESYQSQNFYQTSLWLIYNKTNFYLNIVFLYFL